MASQQITDDGCTKHRYNLCKEFDTDNKFHLFAQLGVLRATSDLYSKSDGGKCEDVSQTTKANVCATGFSCATKFLGFESSSETMRARETGFVSCANATVTLRGSTAFANPNASMSVDGPPTWRPLQHLIPDPGSQNELCRAT